MSTIIIGMIVIILLGLYGLDLVKNRLTTKQMVIVAMMAAVSFVLGMIKIVQLPQGGSITLFSTLPIIVVGMVYGRTAGLTCGLVSAVLSLMTGSGFIHPVQIFLDYIMGTMALGLAGTFGSDTKVKMVCGTLLVAILNWFSHYLSGVVFYGQYADGMNVHLYSAIYNFFGSGVEGLVTCFVIVLVPMATLKKHITGATA